MKLAEIASALDATLENGNPDAEITGVAGIEEAAAGHITFVANPKYAAAAKTTAASAVIVSEDFPAIATGMLRSKNPYLAFARAIDLFYQAPQYDAGVHPTAVIAPTAKIGKNAHIAAYVVIDDDVEIGDDAVLLPHVVIYRGARIGNNFFAHAHAVVREYCLLGDNVILQNGVIVGMRRLWLRPTTLAITGRRSRNPVRRCWKMTSRCRRTPASIAPASAKPASRAASRSTIWCRSGMARRSASTRLLCAQVGLAGSTVVGKNVILAGQVGVAGHCNIGDGVIVTAQSGTHGDIPAGHDGQRLARVRSQTMVARRRYLQ